MAPETSMTKTGPAEAAAAVPVEGAAQTGAPRSSRSRKDFMGSDEQRSEDEGDGGQQLDQDVERGAGGVLQGVAHGVAHDRGLVGGGALAAVSAGLDVLLGVVPGAPAVVHEE